MYIYLTGRTDVGVALFVTVIDDNHDYDDDNNDDYDDNVFICFHHDKVKDYGNDTGDDKDTNN